MKHRIRNVIKARACDRSILKSTKTIAVNKNSNRTLAKLLNFTKKKKKTREIITKKPPKRWPIFEKMKIRDK